MPKNLGAWRGWELRGAFRGIWKLERLVWARKNLGLLVGWKLGECFGVYGNFGVVVLGAWKLGLLAHEKLSVCIRGIAELRWLSWAWWNFGRVRWSYWRVRWRFHVVRWSGVVVFLFRISGNSVAFARHRNFDFKVCLHIPLGWWGAFGVGSIGRSGGLPTEGLRGYPLTIPLFS